MSADRIFLIQNNGTVKNIGNQFKSYNYDTVDKCAELFLGDEARRYELVVPKLNARNPKSVYEWDCNKVTLYAPATPAAHETVLRFCHLGRVQRLEGYCFVVTEVTKAGGDLIGVYDNVPDLIAFLSSFDPVELEDFYVRIVPFNKELN